MPCFASECVKSIFTSLNCHDAYWCVIKRHGASPTSCFALIYTIAATTGWLLHYNQSLPAVVARDTYRKHGEGLETSHCRSWLGCLCFSISSSNLLLLGYFLLLAAATEVLVFLWGWQSSEECMLCTRVGTSLEEERKWQKDVHSTA